jgi:hypothetical protein
MTWREICRDIEAEASSARAAAERVAHRLGTRRDDRRQKATVTSGADGSWSTFVVARPYSSYFYSAVLKGNFRRTDRGCRFEGTVRPGWPSFLFNLTLVLMFTTGALRFMVVAVGGSGNVGSRLGPLALAAVFAMFGVAIQQMVFKDLRRLTADLEAEFRTALTP